MGGVFGVVAQHDCMQTLFYGTDYHSHLGTEYGGIAVLGTDFSRRIHSISKSQFKSKFYEDYQHLEGNKGIGVISDFDEQPMYLKSRLGPFSLVTTGLIENKDTLAGVLMEQGSSFTEFSKTGVNVTELIGKLIALQNSIVAGIEYMFSVIEGSCSLLLLHKDGIYAARDKWGYTPLVVGKKEDAWAVTSETSALINLGFEIVKYLAPGEIICINEQGLVEKRPGQKKKQICTFLWIYTGFPASSYEGINAEVVRERCGRALARRDRNNIDVDMVAGVPDSGIAHAIGYAMESEKPYRRPLVKYTPGYGRSYTPPTQQTRDLIARMKLIPIRDIIKGQRIVVCEDSIVRGTQLKNFTVTKLWEADAKEVHVRPACPPLMFPCKFCLSTRSIQELVTRKAIKALEGRDIEDISAYLNPHSSDYHAMVEWIRKDIGVTSLVYQTIEDMVEAVGLLREDLCLYCWTGECPAITGKKQKQYHERCVLPIHRHKHGIKKNA